MRKITKLGLMVLCLTTATITIAGDDVADLRQELTKAQAEIAALKAQLAHVEATVDHLPEAIFIPKNLNKIKIDLDDNGNEIELSGDIDHGSVKTLAEQAQKTLLDNGYTVVEEHLDKDDEAKLAYEKIMGDIRETVVIEIDKSWLSDKIEYEVEYEKHQ